MQKTRVFVIHDNQIMRARVIAMINAQSNMTVAAASNGNNKSVQMVRRAKTHVVLVDIGLRARKGLQIVASIKKEIPGVKSIVTGLATSQSDIIEFVEAGAAGFILKEATGSEFIATIRSAARGTNVLPPMLTESLFSRIAEHADESGQKKLAGLRISKREKDVVALIDDGLSNKEIAEKLNIATDTVKTHVHSVLNKLGLRSRLEIATYLNKY